jgi:hypothetical protein
MPERRRLRRSKQLCTRRRRRPCHRCRCSKRAHCSCSRRREMPTARTGRTSSNPRGLPPVRRREAPRRRNPWRPARHCCATRLRSGRGHQLRWCRYRICPHGRRQNLREHRDSTCRGRAAGIATAETCSTSQPCLPRLRPVRRLRQERDEGRHPSRPCPRQLRPSHTAVHHRRQSQ